MSQEKNNIHDCSCDPDWDSFDYKTKEAFVFFVANHFDIEEEAVEAVYSDEIKEMWHDAIYADFENSAVSLWRDLKDESDYY